MAAAPELNAEIRERFADAELSEVESEFASVHDELDRTMAACSEEELFTKRYYPFTGTSDLATYFTSATGATTAPPARTSIGGGVPAEHGPPHLRRRSAALAIGLTILMVALTSSACADPTSDLLAPTSGGATTVERVDRDAFSQPAMNLDTLQRRTFERGDALFNREWIPAPSPDEDRDGLGPTFNGASCSACHVLDGRAEAPDGPSVTTPGLVVRLVPATEFGDTWTGAVGRQIQDRGIPGFTPEASVEVRYRDRTGTYADGQAYSLRSPRYSLVDGPSLDGPIPMSPRIAPMIMGMGLLEAVPETTIRALEDPDDQDGDGISGRAGTAPSSTGGPPVLGRNNEVSPVEKLVPGKLNPVPSPKIDV